MKTMDEITNAISEIVAEKLTQEERAALARILGRRINADCPEDEATMSVAYHATVDFLWMAFRISLGEKFQLLDLEG